MNQPPVDVPIEFGKRFIVVEISRKETRVEAFGFGDSGCKSATQPFRDALAGKTLNDEDKREDANGVRLNA